ncbi:hypothetical protein LOCC1_G008282 [Lachnellula occidentalis]|uniref:Heterokaryon incompatibility domain-containing protein n=1 Tax=Lachnellula occidentalis TaxID=215460 RepID=A0A8H8U799_9HELO|nr:hypothetical protein LOCC1_G008282 [Lachnellula occidentalis]
MKVIPAPNVLNAVNAKIIQRSSQSPPSSPASSRRTQKSSDNTSSTEPITGTVGEESFIAEPLTGNDEANPASHRKSSLRSASMAETNSSVSQEAECRSCKGHIPNGENHWMSGSRDFPFSTMSQFRVSKERGCLVCSLVYRAVQAIEPQMLLENKDPQILIGKTISIGISSLSMPWGIIIYAAAQDYKRWPGMMTGPKKVYASDLASDMCFDQVARWINNCVNDHDHPACQQPVASTLLPTRVLDLGLPSTVPNLKLRTIDEDIGPYVTLSHRWGTEQTSATRTTKPTLREREKCIEFDTLPKTFQDAIIVTRRIGIRYLWIDSLCIVQDDVEEWESESAKMGGIYSHSFLTIAAASASSDNQGFLNSRPSIAGIELCSVEDMPGKPDIIAQKQISHSIGYRNPDETTAPLWSRAWAFQEDVLSRRLLTYFGDEMSWQCSTMNACECGGDFREDEFTSIKTRALILKPMPDSNRPPKQGTYLEEHQAELYTLWRNLVSKYTKRDLTKATDILPALSGIAVPLQDYLKDQYVGGMWKGDMVRELVWGVDPGAFVALWHGRLPLDYRAPSFCWASVDSYGIQFPDLDATFSELDSELKMEVMDVQGIPRGKNPMGDLSSGFLKVRALMFSTTTRFDFFRGSESAGICYIAFYPDTQLEEADVNLPSGHTIHTARRNPEKDQGTRECRGKAYARRVENYNTLGQEGYLNSADMRQRASIFSTTPKDIDNIQVEDDGR